MQTKLAFWEDVQSCWQIPLCRRILLCLQGRNFPYTRAIEQLQQGQFGEAVQTTGQLLDSLESSAGPRWALHLKAYAHWWLGDLCEVSFS